MLGEPGDQEADELPPVAERGPGEVRQTFGQGGIGSGRLGVGDHGDGAEQLEAGLPEVVGGVVAVARRLGVDGPAVELGQRQRQALGQRVRRRAARAA